MNADLLIDRISTEVHTPGGAEIRLRRDEAKLLLARVNHLESLAAALLRSQTHAEAIIIPYKEKYQD
jgi:hypothetical protein